MVSETLSSPFRDTFHLSLTVLVHYRSQAIFSLGSLVLPDSNGISPVPPYLRTHASAVFNFHVRGFHPLWPSIPACSTSFQLFYLIGTRQGLRRNKDRSSKLKRSLLVISISQPLIAIRLPTYSCASTRKVKRFWLFPFRSPLLWELRFLSIPVAT